MTLDSIAATLDRIQRTVADVKATRAALEQLQLDIEIAARRQREEAEHTR